MQDLIWFDIITLALVILLGIKGVINGFIKETFGLIGIVGGVYIASRYAQDAGMWIDNTLYAFENKASLFLVGFIGLLVCFWLVSLLVGQIVAKLIDISGLSVIDKLAGFLIGSAKIFLVFSVFLVALSNIAFVQAKIETYLEDSFMYPIFMEVGQKIVSLNPDAILPQTKEPHTDAIIIDGNQSKSQRSPNDN
jgi:membrane protein required for colicin V production